MIQFGRCVAIGLRRGKRCGDGGISIFQKEQSTNMGLEFDFILMQNQFVGAFGPVARGGAILEAA
jgi:hypothetical protein